MFHVFSLSLSCPHGISLCFGFFYPFASRFPYHSMYSIDVHFNVTNRWVLSFGYRLMLFLSHLPHCTECMCFSPLLKMLFNSLDEWIKHLHTTHSHKKKTQTHTQTRVRAQNTESEPTNYKLKRNFRWPKISNAIDIPYLITFRTIDAEKKKQKYWTWEYLLWNFPSPRMVSSQIN